jgi:hypothetical protein
MIQKIKILSLYFKKKIRNLKWAIATNKIYAKAIKDKECYFGPFLGEFGHLLGHNLPFIAHLHKRGVKIHFCGLDIHKCFFYDEQNNLIVENYLEIKDFFGKHLPDCNTSSAPEEVNKIKDSFISTARNSRAAYFDNNHADYYFNFFRWWALKKGYHHTNNLSTLYKTKQEKSVVIFARKCNPKYTVNQLKNNGENWNYKEVATICSKHFDKVYIIGHPIFTQVDFEPFDNVEVHITNDNKVILEKCSNASLIITQHSGSVYLGEYTNSQVLLIYNGGKKESDIGDIAITKQFKKALGTRYNFNYAFSEQEINEYCKEFSTKNNN